VAPKPSAHCLGDFGGVVEIAGGDEVVAGFE